MSRPMDSKLANPSNEQLKSYSCLICRQRKVKCDRKSPCDNCVKAGSQCGFVPPVRGKRKRTKPVQEGMHAKLNRYEDMLKSRGVNIDPETDDDDSDPDKTSARPVTNSTSLTGHDAKQSASNAISKPTLVKKGRSTRYFENSLWTSVVDEFHHPDHGGTDENNDTNEQEDDLFFGSVDNDSSLLGQSPQLRLHEHYPSLHTFQTLKDVFLERIDPLVKVLHIPSFWADAVKAVQNPQMVPRSLEAAVFCFSLAAISVLDEDQCKNIFGEPKATIFARSRPLARQALVNAGLLHTSSPIVLSAFLLFLTSLRGHLRQDTQFILSGAALRLAFKMGLHRDGETLGLPPFETEMRRRLWWHTAHMDFRAADILGHRPSRDISISDAKVPLNVEDEDLYPGMTKFPPERKGITTISTCSVRCEILHFLSNLLPSSREDASWDLLTSADIPTSRKDAMIDEMEDFFERKYLRYCDPTNPLDTLASIMMRSSVCKMRLHAHNPKEFAGREDAVSQAERDIVLSNATKILQYASSAACNPALLKYQWRIGNSYLWDILLYVLLEVKRRKKGSEVERLWPLFGILFPPDSDIFKEKPSTSNAALRKWTLEAWETHVDALRSDGQLEPETPHYIEKMRIATASAAMAAGDLYSSASHDAIQPSVDNPSLMSQSVMEDGSTVNGEYNIPDLISFDMDPNEWLNWEHVLSGTSES